MNELSSSACSRCNKEEDQEYASECKGMNDRKNEYLYSAEAKLQTSATIDQERETIYAEL